METGSIDLVTRVERTIESIVAEAVFRDIHAPISIGAGIQSTEFPVVTIEGRRKRAASSCTGVDGARLTVVANAVICSVGTPGGNSTGVRCAGNAVITRGIIRSGDTAIHNITCVDSTG